MARDNGCPLCASGSLAFDMDGKIWHSTKGFRLECQQMSDNLEQPDPRPVVPQATAPTVRPCCVAAAEALVDGGKVIVLPILLSKGEAIRVLAENSARHCHAEQDAKVQALVVYVNKYRKHLLREGEIDLCSPDRHDWLSREVDKIDAALAALEAK